MFFRLKYRGSLNHFIFDWNGILCDIFEHSCKFQILNLYLIIREEERERGGEGDTVRVWVRARA